LIGFVALPPDFQELVFILLLCAPVVACIFYLAFSPHASSRHVVIFVIALVPLIAAMLIGPFRSWFWR
jgi:hypothetical protein